MEWISVEDRLPETKKKILFIIDGTNMVTGFYSYTFNEFRVGFRGYKNVTHWMPLPDPPEGDT